MGSCWHRPLLTPGRCLDGNNRFLVTCVSLLRQSQQHPGGAAATPLHATLQPGSWRLTVQAPGHMTHRRTRQPECTVERHRSRLCTRWNPTLSATAAAAAKTSPMLSRNSKISHADNATATIVTHAQSHAKTTHHQQHDTVDRHCAAAPTQCTEAYGTMATQPLMRQQQTQEDHQLTVPHALGYTVTHLPAAPPPPQPTTAITCSCASHERVMYKAATDMLPWQQLQLAANAAVGATPAPSVAIPALLLLE